ncbi:MAG: UDP-2,4-diacetamido-2,4,6-trideoxy-beta-L-altropyranose hydrolase [Bacteroidales bacterium]|nr:UDP-2,4-diacetamido-2,4,6-trideoxy-beta-L-altropyranose hydrolase [Bacteroidales bacterium]MCF8456465.1 UDP-2,4-diacetamido-2,4,6-trideoxy-beta-L-altropyranose hydrolase [Bacteroidales bacterium]
MGKPKVILRADGSPKIGMGHFTRTLALSEMLKDDFYLIYATRNPTLQQLSEINLICQEVVSLPDDDSHFDVFLSNLTGDEIVVLDNYFFDTAYQQKIMTKGCKLVCIDDMHDKHYVADAVINHAEGIDESQFSCEPYTQLFLGLKYALLRSPFLKPVNSIQAKKYDLLIGIGGADPRDITSKITTKILNLNLNLNLAVLVGNAYQGKMSQNEYPGVEVLRNLNAQQVSNLMADSSVGLFPSSSVAIEAIAMRLPFLVGYFVENQRNFYNYLISSDMAKPLGDFQNIEFDNLKTWLVQLADNQAVYRNRYRDLIDLKSPNRILETFKNLEYEK